MDRAGPYSTPSVQAGVLTFLLTDIEGSTARWQEDADRMRRSISLHDDLMTLTIRKRQAIQRPGRDSSRLALPRRRSIDRW